MKPFFKQPAPLHRGAMETGNHSKNGARLKSLRSRGNSMKTIVIIIMLCGVLGGYAQTTPRYAASTNTWSFGGLTWSDAIHIPECNKSSFTKSYTDPQCRSYTVSGLAWYYYNWVYVNANAATLCSAPWRVPAKSDFETLSGNTNGTALSNAWGYGGEAEDNGPIEHAKRALYWSSTGSSSSYAYYLFFAIGNMSTSAYTLKGSGFQVRCVK